MAHGGVGNHDLYDRYAWLHVSITLWYHRSMTIASLEQAIKSKRPAVIKEKGTPRFVVLDWKTYRVWQEMKEDLEDAVRLMGALADPKNQKRIPLSRVKKQFDLP